MDNSNSKFLDTLEKRDVLACLIYGCVVFSFAPFILLPLCIALEQDGALPELSWLEIAFHVLNFAVLVYMLREYLQNGWWTLEIHKKTVLSTVAVSVILMLCAAEQSIRLLPGEYSWVPFGSALPIVEAELYIIPGYAANSNPVFATLSMVLLSPVATCCIFYAAGFIPAYNRRPWQGYAAVALISGILVLFNSLILSDPMHQLLLYLCRLPIHFISCWALQKTNTIWTPIFAQAITNLLVCLLFIF